MEVWSNLMSSGEKCKAHSQILTKQSGVSQNIVMKQFEVRTKIHLAFNYL